MKTDVLAYEVLQIAPHLVFRLLGLPPEKADDYTFVAPTLKASEVRIDGVLEPRNPEDPLIILEIYGYSYDRAYTNLFAKAFRLVEERNWKGEFRLLLLFLNSRYDPTDARFRDWMNHGPFHVVYLDQWLTSQPEDPYTKLLKLLVGPKHQSDDLRLMVEVERDIRDLPRENELARLIVNVILEKYKMLNRDQIAELFRPFQGFDPKESNVYKFILEEGRTEGLLEGERKGKLENARALHRKLGLSAEQIADTLEVPLEQVRQWLGQ
jgi:predicted transposase YdaD